MCQSKEFQKYRKLYDEIGEKISELKVKRREVLRKMEQHCNHSNLKLVKTNPFLMDMGIEDESEAQYKCQDCWTYFSLEELKTANIDKHFNNN